ncbi:MAG: uncharacterized protein JWN75_546 [Candidatus Saccharibacteria bacterium]|nr:uncharacterized protein [Candidatus Saccharibacteria bacterium]
MQRNRRAIAFIVIIIGLFASILISQEMWQPQIAPTPAAQSATGSAADLLATIPIKGRAPKTGYTRTQFGNGWATINGCDTRNIILHRDMQQVAVGDGCKVESGVLNDPYTGNTITFKRGADSSADVQIDHVVALSDSWQKGAQQLTADRRKQLANDPLELLAVDGPTNQAKGDGDAATWLPPNKLFRCQYVARQIAVKSKYNLWMTQAEHDAITSILSNCPGQILPSA